MPFGQSLVDFLRSSVGNSLFDRRQQALHAFADTPLLRRGKIALTLQLLFRPSPLSRPLAMGGEPGQIIAATTGHGQ